MEASSSRRGTVPAGQKRGKQRSKRSPDSDHAPVHSLGADLLCAIFALLDHFDLVRCSAVCKPWSDIIYRSTQMRDLYYKGNPRIAGGSNMSIPSEPSMRVYLEGLALEEHMLALSSGSPEVHEWLGHSVRVNSCRMKRGTILTGVGDKVLRLWSAESYKCLNEYSLPNMSQLVDCDFDENKIVGLGDSNICIWRRNQQRSIFESRKGIFTRGLCMSYIDPEAAIGCEDGRVRIFDLYRGSCSRIIRMHGGPVTSLALTDEHLILGGSTFGTITVADYSTGEQLALLKSSFIPTGMKSLNFNPQSFLLFAGSSSGYAHCWDLRTLRPVWETRISPNVIYATHHLSKEISTLAVGGLDGVLRIMSQTTGEVLSSFVADPGSVSASSANLEVFERRTTRALSVDTIIDRISRSMRPPITCLAVGMKKIVTTHNEKYIRMWKFHE